MKRLFSLIILLICSISVYSSETLIDYRLNSEIIVDPRQNSEVLVDYRPDFEALPMRNQDVGNCYAYAGADFIYWYLTQIKGMPLTSGVSPISINWNYHKYEYIEIMEEKRFAKTGKIPDGEIYSDKFEALIKQELAKKAKTKLDFAEINAQEGGDPLRISAFDIFLDEHIKIGSCTKNVNEQELYGSVCNIFNETYEDYDAEKNKTIKLFDSALPTLNDQDIACLLGNFEQCASPKDELFSCILNDPKMPRIELDFVLGFEKINEDFYQLSPDAKIDEIDRALYNSPVYIGYDPNILDPAYKFFFNAFYNIYEDYSVPNYTHASLIVGMTNNEYILRNSWGKDICNERLTFLEEFIAENKKNAEEKVSEEKYKRSILYNMQSPFSCDSSGNFIIEKKGFVKAIGSIYEIKEFGKPLRLNNVKRNKIKI